ncbi:MAG: thiamine ABC transporter substrate-binding protein [Chloroflexota bacterium]|nr:MAG: thiamine ABC transporter substrate-binding protein [Chloroflexota bacterium]
MLRCFVFCLLVMLAALPLSAQESAQTLTVIAHDSFGYSEDVMAAFTEETGIVVEVLHLGDTGTMVNQSVLSREAPLGDVMFGVDNTFLGRALAADLFVPYESPLLEVVPEAFHTDPEHRVTPIDYGDVCLNYDVAYFEQHDLPLPEDLAALADPAYEGLLVVENPATSSPGLAFLLATIGVFGEEGDYTYLDYWQDLVNNDVLVVDDWSTAYYGEFSGSGGSDGTRPLVVSYASSPPAEVYFAEEELDAAPTGVIAADNTCFRQIEYAGILQGTDNLDAAQQFIDFLLSVPFQEDMPLNMFVFPVNAEAELPEVFLEYAEIPDEVIEMDVADIDANRETWIQAWTETVLR